MQKLLKRLIKFLAYTLAGAVILLAIAVGLFRLFLPKLPEYQDELKAWVSQTIGVQVEFSGMDARWGLRGPELNFYDAELIREDSNTRLLAAEEVSIGVATLRLLRDRTVVVDRISVRDTSIEIRERDDGSWWLQGAPADELLAASRNPAAPGGSIEIVGESIELILLRAGEQRPAFVTVSQLNVTRDSQRLAIDADLRLPEALGRELTIAGTRMSDVGPEQRQWDIVVAGRQLRLAGWARLVRPGDAPLQAGAGDLDMTVRFGDGRIQRVAADFAFADVQAAADDAQAFAARGHLEYREDTAGWLLAFNDFALSTGNGDWPVSSLRVEAGAAADGTMRTFDVQADYLNLGDLALAVPWLGEEQLALFNRFEPEGVLENLTASLSGLDTERPAYALEAAFEKLGFAPDGAVPGVGNLRGSISADNSRGFLEIDAQDSSLRLPRLVSETVPLDTLTGKVIWRHSDERLTVLSDSITFSNPGLSANSSLQLTIGADTGPVIDLSSTFSIVDLAVVKAYLPDRLLKPKLYDWFQNALVSGRISSGTARLNGPLAKFPFDNNEGRLLVEARIQDTEFKYLPQWPAAELIDVDAVLDNSRLYTVRNRSTSTGNSIVNANVDIPDLREPVLTIEGQATGTLETIRRYANESPLAKLFAGQLDTISVAGAGSLELDLTVPIKRAREFEVTARVETEDGTVSVPGLKRPVNGVAGAVIIEKDSISSDALRGSFLGRPVTFELQPAPADMLGYGIVLNAFGSVTAEGLIEGLGVPGEGILAGATEYTVSVLFPDANAEAGPAELTVEASSDLVGLGFLLPEPLAKTREEPLAFAGSMRLAAGAAAIETSGGIDDDLRWQLNFINSGDAWDLDRGVLSLGGDPPPAADTRGLHIRGEASDVVFEEWLALGDSENAETNVLERLRSVDLEVTNLRLFGQHLVNHQVRLDRSARDWLVQFDGDDVKGSVFVPYDLDGGRPVVMDMERLILPGDATAIPGQRPRSDPRELPSLSIKAQEFGLGDRSFGAVEAQLARVEGGLQSQRIVATDDTFDIVAEGSWLASEEDTLGSRTAVTATLTSTDVAATMSRLGYSPGLIGDDMRVLLDVDWSGGPAGDFLPTLDGDVEVRLGAGQLDEVEPGAGRVFGLMSIVALPRRLSLDFSDVFGDGFAFDKVEGTFRLDDGDTYTCNLSLEAPAADIAIIGRASLAERDYQQTAMISANVGNALPVVAAATAGPQAAVAVLIFSQIFKKPLQGLGQVYYAIDGSWDNPELTNADAERFAASGELAGCLPEGQEAAAEARSE
ncbi:MAG: YhdP family protein [Pseudomonadota bacterium]